MAMYICGFHILLVSYWSLALLLYFYTCLFYVYIYFLIHWYICDAHIKVPKCWARLYPCPNHSLRTGLVHHHVQRGSSLLSDF